MTADTHTPDIVRPPKEIVDGLREIGAATCAGELKKLGIVDPTILGPTAYTPGKVVAGPALTLQFLPIREDVYNQDEYSGPETQLHRHVLYHTQPGDVVCVDVGVKLDGWFGDGAFTIGVGDIAEEARVLLATTRAALDAGIQAAVAGGRLTDISHAVETAAVAGGGTVIREYGGHGIGRGLHEDPHILNYGPPNRGPRLKVGHVLAIEPILSLGSAEVEVAADGWTTVTTDDSLAAHFEHTVALTADGPCVLTLPAGQPAVGVPV